MKFKQLTSEQRYQISALLALNFSQTEIAKQLSVNRSTMSREIKRNSVEKVYSPEAANRLTQQRRQQALKSMLKPYQNYHVHENVHKRLGDGYYEPCWGPEPIRLKPPLIKVPIFLQLWVY